LEIKVLDIVDARCNHEANVNISLLLDLCKTPDDGLVN